ncbi:membrane protein insertion efficiency factor YidD [Nocardioides sp. R-C-SC26]|uniref:membrane protein insertion efficiency factor YidD n=1 Tax=Nocardioides sp. R-C-SC26 TaxID=2870414 RepID=UPI0022B7CD80|nr:membrane protein insertion efficiency factor YidD [Nocardioides sp. R-C-SC26]
MSGRARFDWVRFDPVRAVLIVLLRLYRVMISPLYGQVCRYYPSCSAYALEAVTVHGSVRGSWLAARRLARCHPWAAGGVDKVPPRHGEPVSPVNVPLPGPTAVSRSTP